MITLIYRAFTFRHISICAKIKTERKQQSAAEYQKGDSFELRTLRPITGTAQTGGRYGPELKTIWTRVQDDKAKL
jgi:hypothetical protein